jgi:hypothetical protein
MNGEAPSPLGKAIEHMAAAARAYLDGPAAHLSSVADRAAKPDYTSDKAAADAAAYGLQLARAWWTGVKEAGDALAYLAEPPGDGYRYEFRIEPVATVSKVTILRRRWTWAHGSEPDGIVIRIAPQDVLMPGTDRVGFDVRPLVVTGQPRWEVDIEITPLGSTAGQRVRAMLNDSTRIFS